MNKWLKIFLVIVTFAVASALIYLILRACNITSISTLKNLISKSGQYGALVYIIILVIALVCFCFVPFLNTALAVLGIALFGSKIAFITNIIAVFFSTTILFFIGDKLGEKFARKLVGEKNLNDAQDLIDHKSKFWLPIFFIIPGVPDEAICLVAGMTKMKYWYLLLVSMIYHAIEIGIFCFIGSGIINWSALSLIDWFVLINIVLIDLYFLFKLEKHLEKNSKKNKTNN
ncbi:MAG: TVP38/TMEM64 family protein [Clostridia bacterium]|nr:TVP38/TMEM64 family protein [Clostridia bacterium]